MDDKKYVTLVVVGSNTLPFSMALAVKLELGLRL